MASEEVAAILSDGDGPSVSFLPPPQSAPQWIIDLAEQNGAFWFQDEVGKLFQSIFTQSNMVQLKPWLLHAYSHQPISNRLKSEEAKLRIDKPAFTFHGLTVFETWPSEIDMSSMLDGFCQRMNYYIAEPRCAFRHIRSGVPTTYDQPFRRGGRGVDDAQIELCLRGVQGGPENIRRGVTVQH